MRFIIEGAWKNTGKDDRLTVDADDAEHAERIALDRGFFASVVTLDDSPSTSNSSLLEDALKTYTSAQLLLLSKFRAGDSPSRYQNADYWRAVLGERPAATIARFINAGLLEKATVNEALGFKCKVPELKSLAKSRGLKTSGVKAELISRLVAADEQAMMDMVKDVEVLTCSATGSDISEAYVNREKAAREIAEQQVLQYLQEQRFSQAARAVSDFEAKQVFARGLSISVQSHGPEGVQTSGGVSGIDWKNYDTGPDVERLKIIFGSTPSILAKMNTQCLDQIRPAAAMTQLWGTGRAAKWVPKGFETGIHLNPEAVCRMLVFHAVYLNQIQQCRAWGIKSVEINGAGDDGCCDECQMISGREFRIDTVPELPFAKCTSPDGCRCMALPKINLPG